jgi:hypothetical protein
VPFFLREMGLNAKCACANLSQICDLGPYLWKSLIEQNEQNSDGANLFFALFNQAYFTLINAANRRRTVHCPFSIVT